MHGQTDRMSNGAYMFIGHNNNNEVIKFLKITKPLIKYQFCGLTDRPTDKLVRYDRHSDMGNL